MAIDSYMIFVPYNGPPLSAESQVDWTKNNEPLVLDVRSYGTAGQVFEIDDYKFDIENTLNIGSQSTGAGAGRITFKEFSITRKIDKSSPTFFQMACSGTSFKLVYLCLRKSSGGETAGRIFLRFDFKLVAVQTISWSHDDESPKEEVTFQYGGLQIRYSQQDANGNMQAPIAQGWNRIKNIADTTSTPI